MRPLAIDLFCGLGGWTEGLLAEGYRVVGLDIERHHYGDAKYPAQLVLQDVLMLHGAQFKDAALIVASPPCQAYSYRAMPWKRAKALPPPDNALFEACFRIQREAIEAAGHHIPLVVENVCGAQKWVGRARWHFGSFYLWGDVPALMPMTRKHIKVPTMGAGWYPPGHPKHVPGLAFNGHADRNLREGVKAGDRNKARKSGGHEWTTGFDKHTKNEGGSWFNVAHNTTSGHGQNPDGRKVPSQRICDCGHGEDDHGFNPDQACGLCSCINPKWVKTRRTDVGKGARFTSRDCGIEADGVKGVGCGSASWQSKEQRHPNDPRNLYSKSNARKAASAHIAKIPLVLARHIAACWKP